MNTSPDPVQPSPDTDNQAAGHRKRLLERFAKSGLAGFHNYEIIELLLTCIIPRRDVKPAAKQLMHAYGSVSGVLNAKPEELQRVNMIGERAALFIMLMREVMAYALRERYERRCVITHRRDVEEYLRFRFGHKPNEYVAVLFLDTAHQVIDTRIVAEGTVNQCAIYPRAVVQIALELGAASLLLVHNHPGGSRQPSDADWALTHRMMQVGKMLDLPLLDHIIVLRDAAISLRELPRWEKN